MKNALVLRANGHIEPYSIPDTDPEELAATQAVVRGYIQVLPIPDESISVFCNEDGQRLGLPFNANADALWGRDVNGPILGDVLILGPVRGEETMELDGSKSAEIINALSHGLREPPTRLLTYDL
jgi:hypothetical protein